MEFPPDKETMRSFLGMINYLNRYSALSAHLAAPLSALTHQATDYKPGKVHFENFNQLKETMRFFLGMINYLNRYSVLSAHLAAPLSALTHQATDYKPDKVHFENFNRLKVEISNMKALPYFDVNAETTLQMDASKKGLGACLIQKGKVICYASRALTKAKQNYQNLE